MNCSEELEGIESSSLVQTVGLYVFVAYLVIVVCGVPSNIYVLCRLYRLARVDNEKYTNGSGAGLFAMAMADLISILSISIQHILASVTLDVSDFISTLLCKVLIFTTHTATSVSIWSWMAMSTMRYLAIRYPFIHLRLYRALYRAITFYVFISSAINFWLLIAVYHDPCGCTQRHLSFYDFSLNRWLQLADCLWSFCIPLTAILFMDTIVLHRSVSEKKRRRKELCTRNANPSQKKRESVLRKFLIIAFVDLMLNTPENIYRLAMVLYFPVYIPSQYNISFRMIAQTLYFSQFAFNAIYLAVFVYDKNIRHRFTSTSSSRSTDMKLVTGSERSMKQNSVSESRTTAQDISVEV